MLAGRQQISFHWWKMACQSLPEGDMACLQSITPAQRSIDNLLIILKRREPG
eukprot:COSAG02_NODE_4499_length_5290_cov_40.601233_4_plen_52_part_00